MNETERRQPHASVDLYVDLLKKCLTRFIFLEELPGQDAAVRLEGRDWPPTAETMIGMKRLENLELCMRDILARGVPGDVIETGVWRGGAVIFMRGILKAFGETARTVWVADSFQGLPKPDPSRYPRDRGLDLWSWKELIVPLDEVKRNFERYGLLDGQVRFLVGYFEQTLPEAPIERLALMRLDGDLYQSTIESLTALYPKLSVGGYVLVDDYGAIDACAHAVEDYRRANGITEPLQRVDWTGVYWKRER